MSINEWLGTAGLLIIVGSGAIWFRAALAVQLPENRGLYIFAWIFGSLLALAGLVGASSWLGGLTGGSGLLLGAFLLLTVAISRQKVAADAISVGKHMPAFSAQDEHGEIFDSATLDGQTVLLKFFRGHW